MKPSIVFVHGACHIPVHYDHLVSCLEQAGYRVVLTQNPSVGSIAPPNAFEADVEQARSNIVEELRSGRDVILVLHSYGGIPGCAALKGIRDLVVQRRVLRVVAYASWLVPEGRSLQDEVGGDITPWLRVEDGLMYYHAAEQACYNDIPDDIKAQALALIQPQAYGTFTAKGQYEAWLDYPFTYVFCDKDQALPPQCREVRPGSRDPFDRRLPYGHSAHAVAPAWVAAIIREAAGEQGL